MTSTRKLPKAFIDADLFIDEMGMDEIMCNKTPLTIKQRWHLRYMFIRIKNILTSRGVDADNDNIAREFQDAFNEFGTDIVECNTAHKSANPGFELTDKGNTQKLRNTPQKERKSASNDEYDINWLVKTVKELRIEIDHLNEKITDLTISRANNPKQRKIGKVSTGDYEDFELPCAEGYEWRGGEKVKIGE